MPADLIRVTLPRAERFPRAEVMADIMPPWPDAFMRRLMNAIAPMEGYKMSRLLCDRLLAVTHNAVEECRAREILSMDARSYEAELEEQPGVFAIAIVDPITSPDFCITLVPSSERPMLSLPTGPRRLGGPA